MSAFPPTVFVVPCLSFLPQNLVYSSNRIPANVDELFIDLCRQMLRKDGEYHHDNLMDGDDALKVDPYSVSSPAKRHRRRRLRDHPHPKCTLL